MTELSLSGLSKRFPGTPAPVLQDLDLTVKSGSLTALLGPSGCGKTTAMKLVAGLLRADAGDILLDGRSIRDLPPERRNVAMVFQTPLLFPHLTVAGNLGFGLRMRGVATGQIAALVNAMLEKVRLSGLGNRRPAELSGGQSQRASLARALILRPDVLLLDEPLSNLDPSLRDDMRGLIRGLQQETGITTLIVTHDQAEAVAMADQIALMLDGKIAQHGAPAAFYQRPASLAVARFFGGVNFLPGQVQDGAFLSGLGPLPLAHPFAQGPGLLTIRPEAISLGPQPDARAGIVRSAVFLGTQTRVTVELSGHELVAIVPPDAAAGLTPGQEVGVTLPRSALWVLPPDQSATFST